MTVLEDAGSAVRRARKNLKKVYADLVEKQESLRSSPVDFVDASPELVSLREIYLSLHPFVAVVSARKADLRFVKLKLMLGIGGLIQFLEELFAEARKSPNQRKEIERAIRKSHESIRIKIDEVSELSEYSVDFPWISDIIADLERAFSWKNWNEYLAFLGTLHAADASARNALQAVSSKEHDLDWLERRMRAALISIDQAYSIFSKKDAGHAGTSDVSYLVTYVSRAMNALTPFEDLTVKQREEVEAGLKKAA